MNENPDFLSVVGFFAVCFAGGKVVGWILTGLVPRVAASWRAGLASGRGKAASRRRDPGASAGFRVPDCDSEFPLSPVSLETIAVVLPEGGRIYARVIAGANSVVVCGSDGIGIRLKRTSEAIPYGEGLATVFRETAEK